MPTETHTKAYLRPDNLEQQAESSVSRNQLASSANTTRHSEQGHDTIGQNAPSLTSEYSSLSPQHYHQSRRDPSSLNTLGQATLHGSAPFVPHHEHSGTLGPLEGHRKRLRPIVTNLESPVRRPSWPPSDEGLFGHRTIDVPRGSASFSPSTNAPSSGAPERSPYARPPPTVSPAPPGVQMNQYGLRIRQQPVSARAGPPGKDRRTVDPPCILQLTITDFDPDSAMHIKDLKDTTHFVVHCFLRPAEVLVRRERNDTSFLAELNETSRLLLGDGAVNAFFSPEDPDPSGIAAHPSTKMWNAPTQSHEVGRSKGEGKGQAPPAAFFIFSDLSIRKAGRYRLEFRLMKMDLSFSQNPVVPVQAQIMSDVFECFNAKDFPSIQPSTRLVKGLLAQGAPRPLSLKKGVQGRRNRGTVDEEDD